MKLIDLAISSWVFSHVADYNNSYGDLVRATGRAVDLLDKSHRLVLLQWLNKWGCRQFAIEHHSTASENILRWFNTHSQDLPSLDSSLESLSEVEIAKISTAYGALVEETASGRVGCSRVRVGPTGAAKILFALRPLAIPPWDIPIRKSMRWNGSGRSFTHFLKMAKQLASELVSDANRLGFKLDEFPTRIYRPDTTIPKLIDEYLWVTITRKVKLPRPDQLQAWLDLA